MPLSRVLPALLLLGHLADAATIANPDLRLTVAPDGAWEVIVAATGRVWRAPGVAGPVRELAADDGRITWRQAVGGKPPELGVSVALDGPAVVFTLAAEADAAWSNTAFPAPLVADLQDGQLCLAPYANGLLIPQGDRKFVGWAFGPAFDLPFIGLSEGPAGDGYALWVETSWDAQIRLSLVAGKKTPQAVWLPRLGVFGPPRVVRCEFVPSGGYVALAKRYRARARRAGLVVTLGEKARLRPEVARLAGAPNVWGGDLRWAREAAAAGLERCLLNYTSGRANMQAVNDLGWLTSRYDNYADMFVEADRAKWDNVRGGADEVLLKADGSQQLAWLTYDKKTQYLKRSSRAMLAAAQRSIPPDLAQRPYLARFLDVTTADGLLEDWRPGARQDRQQDVAARLELFRYVNDRKLVTGGEHGRFWAVPTMDYLEGMMSGGHTSWPAGHLRHPDQGKDGISADYRAYGVGAVHRIPLWELVFGDCAVSYWYWGDSTDYLHRFDPGLTDRKDALNVLYGTPPMYWVDGRLGFRWNQPDERERLLQSYRHTCRWHAEVFGRELERHEYLSPDRLVQATAFAGGYRAVVNFAPEPRGVTLADGEQVTLPPEGFAARGPAFLLDRRLDGERVVTRIRSARYAFVDGGGGPCAVPGLRGTGRCAVRVADQDRLLVVTAGDAQVDPRAFVAGWSVGQERAYLLDAQGQRQELVDLDRLPRTAGSRTVEVLTGARAQAPDVILRDLHCAPEAPRQGLPLTLRLTAVNAGGAALANGRLVVRVDGREVAAQPFALGVREHRELRLTLATAAYDGPHEVSVVAEPPAGVADLAPRDNRVARRVDLAPDRAQWVERPLWHGEVGGRPGPAAAAVVETRLALPAGVAPGGVRVWLAGKPYPAQCETDGTLVFAAPAEPARVEVLAPQPGLAPASPGGGFWRADEQAVVTPWYRFVLADGVLRDLVLSDHREPIGTHLMYSSAATGWTEENGVTESLEVLATGPVRTVVRVKRKLAGGLAAYTRTFCCYERWFTVETQAAPSVTGLHHRLYCAPEPLEYRDSLGRTARIDGQGDAEIKGEAPRWIALSGPRGSLSMVPLSPPSGIAYWDAGHWGGLGFVGDNAASKVAFVVDSRHAAVRPGADDVAWLTTPVALRLR